MAQPPESHLPRTAPGKPVRPLQFQPLSEGLGFHPFADGLPYAPVGKTSGTGATSAGPSRYQPPAPRAEIPRAEITPRSDLRLSSSQPGRLDEISRPGRVHVPTAMHALAAAPIAESHPLDVDASAADFGLLYLLKRVIAYTIDCVINLGLCAGSLSLGLWKQGLNPDSLITPGVLFVFVLFLFAFNWAIVTAQEIAFHTSLGKRIFGLALQGSTSAIFLRAFFFVPSAGFLGVGLLWALFDKKRRCWHDVAVDLQPRELARL